MRLYGPLEGNKNELRQVAFQTLTGAPASPIVGQVYRESADGLVYVWGGASWVYIGAIVNGSVTLAKLAANSVDASKIVDDSITNAEINSGAAIAQSKLALAITNAQVAAGAAIARTKLDFGTGLVNADIATGAAIARAKLDFGTGLVNADIAAGAAIALSKLATDPLARANHTGTQLAATISNFDTQVRTSRLDQMAAPTSAVSLGGQRITNLAEPTASTDAATKNYVDLMRQGIRLKDAVRVRVGTNVNIASPGANLDGIAMVANDRVLLTNQTTAGDNGIYVWNGAAVPMTRAEDANTAAELNDGATTFVQEGTSNATTWAQTAILASFATAQTWTQQGAAASYLAGAGLVLNGSTFDIVAGDTTIVVNADNIVVGVIGTANIGDGAVTTAKIGDGQVTDAKIVSVAVAKVTGAVQKRTANIGNAVATSFVVNHALNTLDVNVAVKIVATGELVFPTVSTTDVNNVTVDFGTYVPATNEFRVVVLG